MWGKQEDKYRNYEQIGAYLNLHRDNSDGWVDPKTAEDLELNRLFDKMDRNISGVGQQYLYYQLHKYESDSDALTKKQNLTEYFKNEKDIREKVQLSLLNLTGETSYFISSLIKDDNLPVTRYYPVFYLLSFLSVVSMLLIPVSGVFLIAAMGMMITNLIINKIFSGKIYEYFAGFSGLNTLINSALLLSRIRGENLPEELEYFRKNSGFLKSFRKKTGYLVINKESLNELVLIAIEYLNMFLLFDIIAYFRSVNELIKERKTIINVYENTGRLDSACSIASFLTETEEYCFPEFTDGKIIDVADIRHPLIENSVGNTLNGLTESALITGSNMAGKTTFIKTLAVNTLLAQTFGFCLAEKFIIPRCEVKTSIRRNDDQESGKSYFFVEIEILKEFIRLSDSGGKYMFLVDEIFRGTNTLERLGASAGVLKYLDQGSFVFCTTHDIELQEILAGRFKMFHFREQIADDNLYFDYKINPGPCTSGNAIKLLDITGYPKAVIQEANDVIDKITNE